MATAPNASQISSDTRAPVSSTNGTSGSPRRRQRRTPARRRGGDESLPCSATAEAYAHRQAQHSGSRRAPQRPSWRRASLTSQPPAPPTGTDGQAERQLPTRPRRGDPGSCAAVPHPPARDEHERGGDPVVEPLSTLIKCDQSAGTARLSITPAPSATPSARGPRLSAGPARCSCPRTAPAPAACPGRSSAAAPPPAAAGTG